jgi:hypothetical protein
VGGNYGAAGHQDRLNIDQFIVWYAELFRRAKHPYPGDKFVKRAVRFDAWMVFRKPDATDY